MSGKRGRGRPRLTFENTLSTTGGKSRKKHEEGICEEVDDSRRGERGI